MRRTRLLRGLSALFLALYVGAGFGVPIADAVLFHLGGSPAAPLPAVDGERPVSGLHQVCLLAQHTSEALPPTVAAAVVTNLLPHAGPLGPSEAAPRDAAPAGLPASRAPPLA